MRIQKKLKRIINSKKVAGFTLRVSNGFTIIELLIVLGILTTVGSIIGSIFYTSLRGTIKSNTSTLIKQNGSYAMNKLVGIIRYGSFEGISDNNSTYTSACTVAGTSGKYLRIRANDNTNTLQVISCCPPPVDPPNIYINTTGNCTAPDQVFDVSASGVHVTSCQFVCMMSSGTSIPVINVNFSLSQFSTTPGGFQETTGSQQFQSSVTLRNWQ